MAAPSTLRACGDDILEHHPLEALWDRGPMEAGTSGALLMELVKWQQAEELNKDRPRSTPHPSGFLC